MALITDRINMKTFEKQPVFLLAIYADERDGHQIAKKYDNVNIEFFANYILIDNETLIPTSKILRISLVDF